MSFSPLQSLGLLAILVGSGCLAWFLLRRLANIRLRLEQLNQEMRDNQRELSRLATDLKEVQESHHE